MTIIYREEEEDEEEEEDDDDPKSCFKFAENRFRTS